MRGLIAFARAVASHPLAVRRPWLAVYRFAGLQIGCRLTAKPRVVPFVDHSFLRVAPGMTGANGNYYFGLHEYADMAFLLHYLRPNDLFIDVGANVGSYTVLASGAVGARSIAFEPAPQTVARLATNIEINDLYDLVTLRSECVGAEDGYVRFSTTRDTMNRIDPEGGILVLRTTLDAAIGGAPDLIKIDTEGHDSTVIEGASRILRDHSPAILTEYIDASASSFLFKMGYADYTYDPTRRLINKGRARGNRLLLKDVDKVLCRLSAAPRYAVHGYGKL